METLVRNALYRLRGWLLGRYLLMHGCKVGNGLRCMSWPVFRNTPRANIFLGDGVSFGKGVVIEVTPSGKLKLDDHVVIGDYCNLSSAECIHLKKWSGIAERVSLRDSFHEMKAGELYRKQISRSAPVVLCEDTGVGAGSVVLMGVLLPEGAFIGANSVVSRHDELEPGGIYAGNPLKLIRKR